MTEALALSMTCDSNQHSIVLWKKQPACKEASLLCKTLLLLQDFYLIRILVSLCTIGASLVAQEVKRLSAMQETRVRSGVGKIPRRRKWQSTPELLPGKSHGWRSLIGYSLWSRGKSDTTE